MATALASLSAIATRKKDAEEEEDEEE